MAAPMPVSRRSTFAATPPALHPIVIRTEGSHDFDATTILGVLGQELVALPHIGDRDAGRFVLGLPAGDSDTVFMAWTRGRAAAGATASFAIEQFGLVIASILARPRVVADVPVHLAGVESAYVLWLSVRSGEVTVRMPPAGAITTLSSITRWVTAEPNDYQARAVGAAR